MQLLKPLIALTLVAGALAHGPSKVHPNPPKPTPTCAHGTSALCCNSVGHANDGFVGLLLELLHVHVQHPRQTLVGVTCSGKGRNGCGHNEKSMCCKDNSHHGVVAVDCSAL